MKTTIRLDNEQEMIGFLKTNGLRPQFISLVSITDVKMNKSGEVTPELNNLLVAAGLPVEIGTGRLKNRIVNPLHGKVRKVSKRNGLLNLKFHESWVKRYAEANGLNRSEIDLPAGETWYVHVMTSGENPQPMPLCVHKEDPSRFYVQYFPLRSKSVYLDENDNEIPFSLIKPFQTEREDTEPTKPKVCVFKLSSIKTLRARGMEIETETIGDLNNLPVDFLMEVEQKEQSSETVQSVPVVR